MKTIRRQPMQVLDATGKPWKPSASQLTNLLQQSGSDPYKGGSTTRRAGTL